MVDKGIETFIDEIKQIIDDSRSKAMRSVDFCRVQMYWAIGKRISEREQQGKERADYGKYIIRNLSKEIEPLYGSGFGVRQLELSRQFYRTYPNANTLCSQLNWSQYKLLIAIPDPEKREYYQLEAVNECWSKRQFERQINSMLYERLLLSNDKEAVLAVARNERVPESPQEIIKDPMVLEFLGLERKAAYYEKDLESAIISHIADFLLEMGKGFSFVARQKRLLVEDDEYFADDIVTRTAEFVRKVYGEDTLDANLKFIADALGNKGDSPREVLRSYYLKDFYTDHLRTYQKRPIYWQFDSGKQDSLKCLAYLHRYDQDTIARIRTDYVHELQDRLRVQLEEAQRTAESGEGRMRTAASKRAQKLEKQLIEMGKYEEMVHHYVDMRLALDLDDGVKVNYAKLGELLTKIK